MALGRRSLHAEEKARSSQPGTGGFPASTTGRCPLLRAAPRLTLMVLHRITCVLDHLQLDFTLEGAGVLPSEQGAQSGVPSPVAAPGTCEQCMGLGFCFDWGPGFCQFTLQW